MCNFFFPHISFGRGTSLVVQMVKRLSTMWETRVRSLGWEDPLKKEMAIHSSTLAWKTPWTEEPGGLQSMGSRRGGHDWATSRSLCTEAGWQYTALTHSFLNLELVRCSMSASNCWFLTCIQVSQEAGRGSGIPISLRIFHSLWWSTQLKASAQSVKQK